MKSNTNISKVFIGFVVISAIIWLFINLIKVYTTKLTYAVSFKGLSQDKVLKDDKPNDIDLLVSATGFKLLIANFSYRKLEVELGRLQKKNKQTYYLITNKQQANVQEQLPSGVTLKKIVKDTLYFNVDVLASKKVPLVTNIDVMYQVGYDAVDKPVISPDSVTISGAESLINDINKLQLEKLTLQNVSDNVQQELNVVLPHKEDKLKVSEKVANVTINVDKFTEGEASTSITINNLPNKKELTIFPKKVTVFFKVGLKNYHKITPESFEVVCDYEQTKNNGINYLIPKIVTKPSFISSVRIVPDKIDFLIRK